MDELGEGQKRSALFFEFFYLVRLAENRNGPGILRAMIYFCFAALIVFAASLYKVSSSSGFI